MPSFFKLCMAMLLLAELVLIPISNSGESYWCIVTLRHTLATDRPRCPLHIYILSGAE